MGGLLYKDFMSVDGKRTTVSWLTVTVILIALRIIAFSLGNSPEFIGRNEAGEEINILDVFFATIPALYLIIIAAYINMFGIKMGSADKKNKIMNYMGSMPFSINTYVASKYIFVLVSSFVFFNLYNIVSVVMKALCRDESMINLILSFDSMSLGIIMIGVFITTIELPFFLLFDTEIANMVITGVTIVIALLVVGYFFFGDITYLEEFDFEAIIGFVEKYGEIIAVVSSISIVVEFLLCYLSYRITCHFMKKKEAI